MRTHKPLIYGPLCMGVALMLLGATEAQQAPIEKPHCKASEVDKDGKCVPRKSSQGADSGIVSQAPIENPLPRCKEVEVLENGKCVPKH